MTASADKKKGLLMDGPAIQRELGVSEHVATAIVRWCANEHLQRVVKPEGIRRTFVYREDVEEWLRLNTRSAA